jgi:methionyl-tRNA formyltransferase
MGSPEFAVPTLEALVEGADFDVVCVASQPDRPKGRGKKVTPTPVRQRALDHGLPTMEMSKKNYAAAVAELALLEPDFVVVAAFGLILRADLINLPSRGCVNLHPSLLPRHRGVSPVQTAILDGDAETGCTTMLIDEGVDTGDLLLARPIPIANDDTTGTLERKLARLGAPLMVDTLRGMIDGTVEPKKQDGRLATHTKKVSKEDGLIDWTRDADTIGRQIRAMTPWPSAYTTLAGRRLIVLQAVVGGDAGGPQSAGRITSLDPFTVGTGNGVVELATVKMEGKREMSAKGLVVGYGAKVGDILG